MSSHLHRSTEHEGDASSVAQVRFDRLCAPLRNDVLRFLFWLCADRGLAEDVLQETLLRAWRSIDSLKDESSTRAWLLTIARRELARVYERKRLATVDLESAIESHDEALATSESPDVLDVRRAIARLELTYREPLVMQVLLGLSAEEIAAELNISVPAVLTRLFRARELLRRAMQESR